MLLPSLNNNIADFSADRSSYLLTFTDIAYPAKHGTFRNVELFREPCDNPFHLAMLMTESSGTVTERASVVLLLELFSDCR